MTERTLNLPTNIVANEAMPSGTAYSSEVLAGGIMARQADQAFGRHAVLLLSQPIQEATDISNAIGFAKDMLIEADGRVWVRARVKNRLYAAAISQRLLAGGGAPLVTIIADESLDEATGEVTRWLPVYCTILPAEDSVETRSCPRCGHCFKPREFYSLGFIVIPIHGEPDGPDLCRCGKMLLTPTGKAINPHELKHTEYDMETLASAPSEVKFAPTKITLKEWINASRGQVKRGGVAWEWLDYIGRTHEHDLDNPMDRQSLSILEDTLNDLRHKTRGDLERESRALLRRRAQMEEAVDLLRKLQP